MRVSLGPSALRDLMQIGEYLLRESPRAADAFSQEMDRVGERLSIFPDSGSPLQGSRVRFVMLSGFPYKVFYRRLSRTELRIMRVRHGRRRPLRVQS